MATKKKSAAKQVAAGIGAFRPAPPPPSVGTVRGRLGLSLSRKLFSRLAGFSVSSHPECKIY